MIRISNPTIFGGGFQAPSKVTLPRQKPVTLGRAPSGRMIEAKAALDEAVRNREAVEQDLSKLESLIGPEAVVQALEEAEASVIRERGIYNQVLAEERTS